MSLGGETIGEYGERIAQQHYVSLGFSIFHPNFYNHHGKRYGEIDFVAKNENTIIFVEVKTRTNSKCAFQSAVESVTFKKRQRLLKIIKWYILVNKPDIKNTLLIDVCVVLLDKTANYVRILSNAVEDLY